MKKFIKLMSGVMAMFVLAVVMTGCFGVSGKTVQFIDYNGDLIETKIYMNDEEITIKNSPTPNARVGYEFVGWEEVSKEDISMGGFISASFEGTVMQATYNVNVNDPAFNQPGRKYEWNGSSVSGNVLIEKGKNVSVLVRDMSDLSNYSHIKVQVIESSDGDVFGDRASMNIYDKNGKEYDSVFMGETWSPVGLDSGCRDFVVEISASKFNNCLVRVVVE